MTNLSDLIAWIEAASGPDRAIDWAIHLRDGLEGVGMYGAHPAYTTSIDAALTLVPEGYAYTIYGGDPNRKDSASLGRIPNPGELMADDYVGEGATPALALCAAALKARQS